MYHLYFRYTQKFLYIILVVVVKSMHNLRINFLTLLTLELQLTFMLGSKEMLLQISIGWSK